MDSLTREAMLARQANMTCGKWKALQKPVVKIEPEIPEGWKECIGCGKPFKPHDVRQRYCETTCQWKVNYAKSKKRARERARRAKKGY